MRRIASTALVALTLAAGAVTYGAEKGSHHPLLAAAQQLVHEASDKLTAAQRSNEFDTAGHARKAQELLVEAEQELKAALAAAGSEKGPRH